MGKEVTKVPTFKMVNQLRLKVLAELVATPQSDRQQIYIGSDYIGVIQRDADKWIATDYAGQCIRHRPFGNRTRAIEGLLDNVLKLF